MEERRRQAAKMFGRGLRVAEVARRCQVARQVAYRWHEAWIDGGEAALASKGSAGPNFGDLRLTLRQLTGDKGSCPLRLTKGTRTRVLADFSKQAERAIPH